MAKLGSWSTTAGSNNTTPPDGWPEGQAPSTVNDCAREMMARIREVFNDVQYFDQNLTPTFINATSFSVAGDQTSAIVAGRRLKIFDATAGVATAIYATVLTASFTVVTTVSISADGGQLTSSLSSFAMSILSPNNSALPRPLGVGSLSAENVYVSGTLTASGATVLLTTLSVSGAAAVGGALNAGSTLSVSGAATLLSTLSVSGAAVVGGALSVGGATMLAGTLSVSGTAVAANIPKAWALYDITGAGITNYANFNVASVSRSATGVSRINFSNAFVDTSYGFQLTTMGVGSIVVPTDLSKAAANCKFTCRLAAGTATDNVNITASFLHL